MIVQDLIRQLETSSERGLAVFRKMLEELNISPEWVRDHTPDPVPVDGYNRHLLHHGRDFELVLATWSPGGRTLIHDHGSADSFGVVRVLRGRIFNHIYKANGTGELGPSGQHVFSTGSFIPVPRGLIHLMGNSSETDYAMSLHLYSPAITGVCYWDPLSMEPAEP